MAFNQCLFCYFRLIDFDENDDAFIDGTLESKLEYHFVIDHYFMW